MATKYAGYYSQSACFQTDLRWSLCAGRLCHTVFQTFREGLALFGKLVCLYFSCWFFGWGNWFVKIFCLATQFSGLFLSFQQWKVCCVVSNAWWKMLYFLITASEAFWGRCSRIEVVHGPVQAFPVCVCSRSYRFVTSQLLILCFFHLLLCS